MCQGASVSSNVGQLQHRLAKNDSGNFEQAFLIGNHLGRMEEGKLILCVSLAN